MTPDPTLEALMAGGHYVISADRYEEETGDSELAALMRIDGLEWELVDGVPALRLTAVMTDLDRWFWWDVRCGRRELGTVFYNGPEPLAKTSLPRILAAAGYGQEFAQRFYQLFCAALPQECEL